MTANGTAEQYSMTQAAFVIARFLQRFDGIQRLPGADNLKKGWQTVLTPANGVNVRLHQAPVFKSPGNADVLGVIDAF